MKISFLNTLFRVLVTVLVVQLWHPSARPVFAVELPLDKGPISKSTVSDILDSLVNATYFKDEHFAPPFQRVGKVSFSLKFCASVQRLHLCGTNCRNEYQNPDALYL